MWCSQITCYQVMNLIYFSLFSQEDLQTFEQTSRQSQVYFLLICAIIDIWEI